MATASPLNNRTYDHGMGSGLAGMSTVQIGRPMTAERRMERAERFLVSQGDPIGAAQIARQNEFMGLGLQRQPRGLPALPNDRLGGLPPLPPMVPRVPAPLPALPSGKLVPGRSAGSMVWQPDVSSPLPQAPSSKRPGPMAPPEPPEPPEPPAEEPLNPFQLDPLGNYVNPTAGMVPSGFTAMNEFNASRGLPMPPPGLYGQEAAPMLSSAPIPGTDQVMPMVMGQPKGTPVSRSQPKPQAEWQAPKMYDETIPEVRDAQGNVKSPARTRQYYFVPDPKTGKPMKEYALDANGDGVPDNQQPGWMDWLQGQK